MKALLTTSVGRLRLVGYMEATSLLLLVFIAMPLKHWGSYPQLSSLIGPIHGALFLLFVINAISVAIERQWKFRQTTWKVLLSCMIPFGTFYIDRKILRKL